jgi:hypothetical protein
MVFLFWGWLVVALALLDAAAPPLAAAAAEDRMQLARAATPCHQKACSTW